MRDLLREVIGHFASNYDMGKFVARISRGQYH